ncbi:HEAT repeat domain-containing protein [Salirhabdus sp. Marseille-P4669]|uniref:HEAT repeat domain-containing protein n=1 Tax=Salirhabdus sp. Marseille-P4669 TaxID=2042310 RepID=UPI000C7CF677|nr:HEAT repeat domain-containing protein [Salirhabdus sp. Marseille-P4669]
MEVNKVVEKCIESANAYGIAAYEVIQDSRKTNHLYDKNFKNYKMLKQFGNKGIVELEKLLEHPSDYVKYSSATHLLSVKEDKAKEVLKKLVNKPQLFGFSVEMLLREWDKGNLKNI